MAHRPRRLKRAAGSFGSRNTANWSRAGADARKRAEASREVTSAGQAMPTSAPSQDAIRRCIAAGECPWCADGPYRNLGLHTNLAHGVSAAELRTLAGYSTSVSICSPELSEKARQRLEAREDREEISRKGAAAAAAVGAHHKALAAQLEQWKAEADIRDAEIIRRVTAGEFARDVAASMDIHPKTVREALRRNGMDVDLRSLAAKNPERVSTFRASMAQAQWRDQDQIKSERLARFAELGADWAAVHACAEEWEVSAKTATAYLREAGVNLPDGRATSPRRLEKPPRPAKPKKPCNEDDCQADAIKRGMCTKHYQRWRNNRHEEPQS